MTARTPQELHDIVSRCFQAKDIDSLMGIYAEDAVMAPAPGQLAPGRAAIREAFLGFFGITKSLKMQPTRVIEAGDTALLLARWTLVGTGPDGADVEMQGDTTDVARRQPDGTWKMVIDSPFGVEAL